MGSDAYSQFKHAPWHGWTFADIVFPFFLWIMGFTMVFSFKKRIEKGVSKRTLFFKILRRSLLLFGLGLLLNNFAYFNLAHLRIPGVLQRIAICYLIAGIIFLRTKMREQMITTFVLLVGYWLILKIVPVPGLGPGILSENGNIVQYVDMLLLKGHLLSDAWDPEGILSTIPAVATVLFGVISGQFLVRNALQKQFKTASLMFFGGIGLVVIGLIMNIWFPINKNLWTSSFAVFTAGLALISFSIFYYLVDVKGYSKWFHPLEIYGLNPLSVYILSEFISKTLMIIKFNDVSLWDYIYTKAFLSLFDPKNASLLFALAHVLIMFAVAYVMYRKKWFLRI